MNENVDQLPKTIHKQMNCVTTFVNIVLTYSGFELTISTVTSNNKTFLFTFEYKFHS